VYRLRIPQPLQPHLLDTPPPSRLVKPEDSTLAFHITGIRRLHKGGQYDPVEVIKGLLYTVGQQFFYTRIQLVDLQPGEPRANAGSAIVHFTSNYHKNNTVVKIKAHLAGERIREVAISDCFSKDKMEDVRLLKYYGGKLRHEGKAARTRLINRFATLSSNHRRPPEASTETHRYQPPSPGRSWRPKSSRGLPHLATGQLPQGGGRSLHRPQGPRRLPPLINLTSGGPASKSPPRDQRPSGPHPGDETGNEDEMEDGNEEDKIEDRRPGTRMGEEGLQEERPPPSWASAEASTTEVRGNSHFNTVTVTGPLG